MRWMTLLLALLMTSCGLPPRPQPATDWGALAKGVGQVETRP
jgi:hypothetical protein